MFMFKNGCLHLLKRVHYLLRCACVCACACVLQAAHDAIGAATAATGRDIAVSCLLSSRKLAAQCTERSIRKAASFVQFYQCNWGAEDPWLWAPEVANLFRNTGDICSPGSIAWDRILSNFDNTVAHSSTPPATPGLPGTVS
jgi:hypothetical protein